jgi:hypothetical protein
MRALTSLLLFFATITAEASQFSRCSTYLLAARANHFNDSVSEQHTAAAFEQLNIFRTRNLSNLAFSPSNTPASARENSSELDRQAVASRMATLFSDRRIIDRSSADGAPLREKIYGTVFVGDEIQVELENRDRLRDAARSLSQLALARTGSSVLSGLYAAIVVKLAIELPHTHDTYLTAVAAGMLYYGRHFPEEFIRFFQDAFSLTSDARQVRQVFDQLPAPRGWYYRSFDVRIPLDVVRDMWEMNEATNHDVSRYLTDTMAARTTYSVTGNRVVSWVAQTPDPSSGWLRVDEFMTFDANFKPQLVTFVRVSEQLPAYPKTSTEPARQRQNMQQTSMGFSH